MKILIIGCGRMGSGLAMSLSRSHHEIAVVDTNQDVVERMGSAFSGHIIIGDALDRESLMKGGINRADGLAAVTGNDMINAIVARVARQVFRVPKVVARIHDPQNSEIYQRLGVQTVTNVSLGIQRFYDLLTFSHLEIIHTMGNGEVGIVQFEIPPLLAGHMVKDVTVSGEIQVIALTRDGKTNIPSAGLIFQKGDILHIAVEENSVERLKTLMRFI